MNDEAVKLMVNLVERNAIELDAINANVQAHWQNRALRAEATILAIRNRMDGLFLRGYMPTESVINSALYPTDEQVQAIIDIEP